MERVEQYISEHTRKGNNEYKYDIRDGTIRNYYIPWLTPDHTRRVAEIAREETIENTLKWLESCRGFILTEMDIEQFKKYMEEQL